MSAVWYVGWDDVRTLASGDWDAAGVDDTGAFTWSPSNGYSVPQASFTAAQVAWLRSQDDFAVDSPDGSRVMPVMVGDQYVTMSQLRQLFSSTDLTSLGFTKTSVGLGNVDNTADAIKPVSAPVQAALNGKADYPAGGVDGQVLAKSGGTTVWAAPGGQGSVGVTPSSDAYWASGTVYSITGSGVAAASDPYWASGTVYTVN